MKENLNKLEFLKCHGDQAWFWETISWKLQKMYDTLKSDDIVEPSEQWTESLESILKAKKVVDEIKDEMSWPEWDNVEPIKDFMKHEQEYFESKVDEFAAIVKKHSRGWWD
jgi:hypothetical protein